MINIHNYSFEYWLDTKIDEVKDVVDQINNQTESGNFNSSVVRKELRLESELEALRVAKEKYDNLKELHRLKEFYDRYPDKFVEDIGIKLYLWQRVMFRLFRKKYSK